MVTKTAISVNKIKIRLTSERWQHIVYSHQEIDELGIDEVLKTINEPDAVLAGNLKELLAIRKTLWNKIRMSRTPLDTYIYSTFL